MFHISHINNPADHRRVDQQVLAERSRKILQSNREPFTPDTGSRRIPASCKS